jgi:hypothetical protein
VCYAKICNNKVLENIWFAINVREISTQDVVDSIILSARNLGKEMTKT